VIAKPAMQGSLPSLAVAGSVRSGVDKIELLVSALLRWQRRCDHSPYHHLASLVQIFSEI